MALSFQFSRCSTLSHQSHDSSFVESSPAEDLMDVEEYFDDESMTSKLPDERSGGLSDSEDEVNDRLETVRSSPFPHSWPRLLYRYTDRVIP